MRSAGKQDLAARSELNDRTLLYLCAARLAAGARELNRNANRRSFREKACQVSYRIGMRRARLSCALLRQAMMPLSPGLVLVRLGSPSSRLGRASGSQNTRLCRKEMHDRDHRVERKD